MAFKKYYFQEIVVAANANVQQFQLNTPDNFQQQTITELYTDDTTARHVYGLMVNGDQLLSVNAPRFAAGNELVKFNIVVDAGTPPTVTAQDLTGTGVTHVGVLIAYEVNQQ